MLYACKRFCNYIYEKFENLWSINKNILEYENNQYCIMQDGSMQINIIKKENILEGNNEKMNEKMNDIKNDIKNEKMNDIKNDRENKKINEKIKIRMESYRR